MARPYTVRELLITQAPTLLALVLLALAPLWTPLVPGPEGRPQLLVLAAVSVLGALGALHRPMGAGGLGAGAAILPLIVASAGTAWAMAVAGGTYLLAEGVRRLALPPPSRGDTAPSARGLAAAGRIALAAGAAGLTWWLLIPERDFEAGVLARGAAPAAAVYFAVAALLRLEARRHDAERTGSPARMLAPLAPDLLGWLIGAPVVLLAEASWPAAVAVLVGVALLSAEAARSAHRRGVAVHRIRELRRVSAAGQRIVADSADPSSIARQVLAECRDLVPFSWFQFELLGRNGEAQSWCAAAGGPIQEGAPRPAGSPSALPGIHRRSAWKIVVRNLEADGEIIGRLRFWCDPRRLEPTSVELLDSLLPQITSSVQRALLEREAKFDPLTGLADRRLLESRLERAFAECRSEGRSMAVVMCDLDRFKRINDRFGHAAGDGALIQVAELLEASRREGDLCCRYGGEEFAVVLERGSGEAALQVAERLRQAVERCVYTANGRRIPLTVSAGVAAYPELHVATGPDLLPLADEALYEAKRRGRNRCLLNLGRGRFQEPGGTVLEPGAPKPEIKPPTLF